MQSLLEKYKTFLPLSGIDRFESIGEGNTPLVRSSNPNLFFKMEHLNPTGSFKDRFAAVETALIKASGIKSFIATSSGNTGSALAAFAARHDLRCLLFVNEIAPVNKLQQMLAYGAEVFSVKNFGVTSELSAPIFQRLQDLAGECATRLVISAFKYSPEGMEGVKTIAYEIVEKLGEVPENIVIPVGGGGLLSAVWRGFVDLKEHGLTDRLPRIIAVQPALNDTIVTPLSENLNSAREVATTTAISGLAVQVDIDGTRALTAVRESGGFGICVADEEIYETRQQLARREGVYVEPAGATTVAGYMKAISGGQLSASETSICILTGHGLKDTGAASGGEIKNIGLDAITPDLIGGRLRS